MSFQQDQPVIPNPWSSDTYLQSLLHRFVPAEILSKVVPDLSKFGDRCVNQLWDLSVEAEENPPSLVQFDAWGKRIDKIVTSSAWKQLHDVSAEEGIIGIAYESESCPHARVLQMAKLYMFNPFSAVYTCPLAMTDGAAYLIRSISPPHHSDSVGAMRRDFLQKTVLPHLVSRSPGGFWTSGQWMTEKPGGSDVSRTETIFTQTVGQPDGTGVLNGLKWFTSATDADMAMALGRESSDPKLISLFFISLRDDRNKMVVHRLKNKLGTKAVPTAELTLQNVPAFRVGAKGSGVREIARMINVTRVYNAISAVAFARHMISWLRDYSTRRVVFGKLLTDQPLFSKTMATLEVEWRACMQLVFFSATLLGKVQVFQFGLGPKDEHADMLLRVLTPVIKLYTAKKAIAIVSEAIEGFGGQGYIESGSMPRFLRDSQVLSIWEGCTNVLALDLFRALRSVKFDGVVVEFWKTTVATAETQISKNRNLASTNQQASVQAALKTVRSSVDSIAAWYRDGVSEIDYRDFAFSFAYVFASVLFVDHLAQSSATELDVTTLSAWIDLRRFDMVTRPTGTISDAQHKALARSRL
eukprot:ANDGO_06433.mRNA.1 Acyl-CoA dehydrogenase family member 11